ncbi:MAG TPA: DNA recombination protein RmuC, partial [Desulfobulbus sp.]|nr:DNA recombination protein RmuC [Desulfobulbus sp.]
THLHVPSLVTGAAGATILLLTGCLTVYTRLSRRNLGLTVRLEQATRNIRDREDTLDRLRAERDELRLQLKKTTEMMTAQQRELDNSRHLLREREKLFTTVRDQMRRDFELLAGRVLQQQGKELDLRHESGLQSLLEPMRRQLADFRTRVEDVYDKKSRDHAALVKEIELLRDLNQQLSNDALRLTRALQGSHKIQGQWGEMILEKLLEDSGLRKGREFATQPGMRNEDGRLRQPDVIVHLPGKRDIIIDAKVSLKAWAQAAHEEDEKKQRQLLKCHLDSLRHHIKGLSGKAYHRLPGVNTVDFVLLFMPAEGAFQAAVSLQPDLLTAAMRKKIVLTGPSTLLAVLRTIHHLWRVDEQGRNSLAIAKQAGQLYDKFVGFAEAFEEIGFRLEQGRRSWQTARKRLVSGRGNLVDRIESLKELGVQPERNLPEAIKKNQL